MINPEQLLTPQEAAQVDASLMTNKEKFGTRIAIYSLRVLKQIAAERGIAATDIETPALHEFLEKTEMSQAVEGKGFALDDSFKVFWSNIIASSTKQLHQVADVNQTDLGSVTAEQTIAWFEAKAKEAHGG